MKKMVTFIISILFIFNICSCAKNDKKNEYDTYEVKSNSTSFAGYVDSKNYKSYMITEDSILSVNNGDIVTKGQELYKTNNQNSAENAKKNNKLRQLTNNSNEISDKIASCTDPLAIQEYTAEKQDVENSIEEVKSSKLELERSLSDLKIDIQYESQSETADFDGQIIINDSMLELYSLNYEIVYNATQQQVNLFEKDKQYKVEMNDEEIGTAILRYIIPNDDLTNKGTSSYYKVVFDIETDKTLLRNNIINIIDINDELSIPEDYVKEEDGEFFVKKEAVETKVNLEKDKSSYKVISGINKGDILESYKVKE